MVVRFSARLSAVLLALALVAGQAGVCAGWMPTPEARMACCSDDGPCPMHKSESEDGPTRVISQAEADRCCAASEHEDSTPSQSNAAFFVTLAVALTPIPGLLPAPEAHADTWRTSVPIPTGHVPKHVLLSVFLV
jgi:hypothetical protein